MPLYLISIGTRPLCLIHLVAWDCMRHLKLLWQSFCVSSFSLCSQLLSTFSGSTITLSSIPDEELAISCLSAVLFCALVPEVPASQLSKAKWLFQSQLDVCQSNSLLSSCSFCDQTRICAISSQ